ncbi:hypothetical protein B0H11DRAFT_1926668 [Mycena galericulata]|nr:hypothetical protein B0H11DRAFT_1926668 [Mycena galericulata]
MDETNTFCAGTGPDGKCCICRRCVLKTKKEPDDADICKNCSHMESAHPPTGPPRMDITSYVENLRDAGKVKAAPGASSSKLKSSLSEAEAETTSGLRPNAKGKRKNPFGAGSRTDTEPEASQKRPKTDEKVVHNLFRVISYCAVHSLLPKEKLVPVQKVAFLPNGMVWHSAHATIKSLTPFQNGSGILNLHKLTPTYLDLLLSCGLVKLSTPEDRLEFSANWTNAQMCTWIEGHFPDPIGYLKTHPYGADTDRPEAIQRQLWRLCIKSGHELSVSTQSLPTGANAMNVCAPPGRTIAQRVLIITSKHRIPVSRYTDWDGPDSDDEEYIPSEEDESETPSGKGKNKVLAVAKPRKAGRSTRLSTGAITWNKDALIHNVDSGDEEHFPEALALMKTNSSTVPISSSSATTSTPAASGSSGGTVPGSSSTIVPPPSAPSQSPLFNAFSTPSPPSQADDGHPTFFSHWQPPPILSPNNSRWAAALAAATEHGDDPGASSSSGASTSQGGFPGSVRNTRPDPWA